MSAAVSENNYGKMQQEILASFILIKVYKTHPSKMIIEQTVVEAGRHRNKAIVVSELVVHPV